MSGTTQSNVLVNVNVRVQGEREVKAASSAIDEVGKKVDQLKGKSSGPGGFMGSIASGLRSALGDAGKVADEARQSLMGAASGALQGTLGGLGGPLLRVAGALGGVGLAATAATGAVALMARATRGYADTAAQHAYETANRARRMGIDYATAERRGALAASLLGDSWQELEDRISRRFTARRLERGILGDPGVFRRLGITPHLMRQQRRAGEADAAGWLRHMVRIRENLDRRIAASSGRSRELLEDRLASFYDDTLRVFGPEFARRAMAMSERGIRQRDEALRRAREAFGLPVEAQQAMVEDSRRLRAARAEINENMRLFGQRVGFYSIGGMADAAAQVASLQQRFLPALADFIGVLGGKAWQGIASALEGFNQSLDPQIAVKLTDLAIAIGKLDVRGVAERFGGEIGRLFNILSSSPGELLEQFRRGGAAALGRPYRPRDSAAEAWAWLNESDPVVQIVDAAMEQERQRVNKVASILGGLTSAWAGHRAQALGGLDVLATEQLGKAFTWVSEALELRRRWDEQKKILLGEEEPPEGDLGKSWLARVGEWVTRQKDGLREAWNEHKRIIDEDRWPEGSLGQSWSTSVQGWWGRQQEGLRSAWEAHKELFTVGFPEGSFGAQLSTSLRDWWQRQTTELKENIDRLKSLFTTSLPSFGSGIADAIGSWWSEQIAALQAALRRLLPERVANMIAPAATPDREDVTAARPSVDYQTIEQAQRELGGSVHEGAALGAPVIANSITDASETGASTIGTRITDAASAVGTAISTGASEIAGTATAWGVAAGGQLLATLQAGLGSLSLGVSAPTGATSLSAPAPVGADFP